MSNPERNLVYFETHTASFTPGALGSPEKYVQAADRLRERIGKNPETVTLGITDQESISAWSLHERACRDQGIQPIFGVWLRPNPPLGDNKLAVTLLVQKAAGFQSLFQLDRLGKERELELEDLGANQLGLVAIAPAESYTLLADIYGEIFFKVTNYSGQTSRRKLEEDLILAQKQRARVAASNEVWAPTPADINHLLSSILCAASFDARTRAKLFDSQENRFDQFQRRHRDETLPSQLTPFTKGAWLRPGKLYRGLFKDVETVYHPYQTAVEIAQSLEPKDLPRPALPRFPLPEGASAFDYLRSVCEEGIKQRYNQLTPSIKDRLDYELSIIGQQQLADFFLIAWDINKFCQRQGIRTVGIGSGTGSLVCYSLGITQVEPLANELLFQRLLTPSAAGEFNNQLLQIADLDWWVDPERRKEIFDYVINRFSQGKEGTYVARIAMFPNYGIDGAVRTVLRVFGYPERDITQIQGLIWQGKPFKPEVNSLLILASQLAERKLPNGLVATHPSKLIISGQPLEDCFPIHLTNNQVVAEIDRVKAEEMANLDFVNQYGLTLIERVLERVALSEEQIPRNEAATLKMVYQGEVIGIPLIDTWLLQKMLVEFKTAIKLEDFSERDLMLLLAFARPAARSLYPAYLRRRASIEEVIYPHPVLEEVLGETLGLIVFQEQVISLAEKLAGFPVGARDLRRAISKEREPEKMASLREKFVKGTMSSGLSLTEAQDVFSQIAGFIGYGFLKGHALAIEERVVYQAAFLKKHFPQEYQRGLTSIGRGPFFGQNQN